MANRPLTPSPEELREVASHFPILGGFADSQRYGSGHINDTFLLGFDQAGVRVRYILQRINRSVFKNVPQLMENISRVTSHLSGKSIQNESRLALTLVPTCDGAPFYQSPAGDAWRVYLFIEGARGYDSLQHPRQAFEAARAFGKFQQSLADLPGRRLHETIPHFHHTPRRLEALRQAAQADVVGRKAEVLPELEFAFQRETEAGRLLDLVSMGQIPERITHNDCKLNNVLLDTHTDEGICVIDLDTVMPGLSLYDLGDLVRSATNTAAEDEADPTRSDVSLSVFEAIVKGYILGAGDILTEAEWENRACSGKLMTYEVGIRFLTDYLQGDIYFKIRRPGQNLDRARNQFRLVARMEAAANAMNGIVCRQRLENSK